MVFKSLILRTLKSGLETMVTEPCGVQKIGRLHSFALSEHSCVEPPRQTQNIAFSAQEQWRWVGLSHSAIELRIAPSACVKQFLWL